MTRLPIIALALFLTFPLATPTLAAQGPGCVRTWARALAGIDTEDAYHGQSQNMRNLRELPFDSKYMDDFNFIAYECQVDPAIVKVIIQDEVPGFKGSPRPARSVGTSQYNHSVQEPVPAAQPETIETDDCAIALSMTPADALPERCRRQLRHNVK